MKKFFSMLVMVLLMISLAGCSKSMNYVIGNEPSFVGTVEVVTDEYVLVNVNDDDAIYSDIIFRVTKPTTATHSHAAWTK